MGKEKIVCVYIYTYIGYRTVLGVRHPLGSWNVSPTDKGGLLSFVDKVEPICMGKLALVVIVVVIVVMIISQ